MLILSRKIDETIVIGDEVRVTVLGISGKTVKLGIDAPHEIPVHRLEVHNKMERESENESTLNDNN